MWKRFMEVDLLPDWFTSYREKLQNHWIFGLCRKIMEGKKTHYVFRFAELRDL